jgi:hypothetical protein
VSSLLITLIKSFIDPSLKHAHTCSAGGRTTLQPNARSRRSRQIEDSTIRSGHDIRLMLEDKSCKQGLDAPIIPQIGGWFNPWIG